MPSPQETIYAALVADATLTALVEDRVYPGQVPDDEDPAPWLYYALPESTPLDTLDDSILPAVSQMEFHALGDSYATAKGIIDAVFGVLNGYVGGQVSRALWDGTSEETTEAGYHHVARFRVWWAVATIVAAPGSNARITTGADSITFTAGGLELVLDSDGLTLDGVELATVAELADYQPLAANLTALSNVASAGGLFRTTGGAVSTGPLTLSVTSSVGGLDFNPTTNGTTGLKSYDVTISDGAAFRTAAGLGTGDAPTFAGLAVTGSPTFGTGIGGTAKYEFGPYGHALTNGVADAWVSYSMGGPRLAAARDLQWFATDNLYTSTADLKLSRDSAGVVKVADGAGAAGAWLGMLRPPHLADAAAPANSVYYSTTAGKLVYKDGGGTVNPLY